MQTPEPHLHRGVHPNQLGQLRRVLLPPVRQGRHMPVQVAVCQGAAAVSWGGIVQPADGGGARYGLTQMMPVLRSTCGA